MAVHTAPCGRTPPVPSSGRLLQFQLEQLGCVGTADLDALGFADLSPIEPARALADILERPVDREHHPRGADLSHRVHQRWRMEVAGRGDVKMLAEVIPNSVFGCVSMRCLHPTVTAVDAPELHRDTFAEMAEHDLQAWTFVEQAAADEAQRVHGSRSSESPVRPEQQ